MRVWTKEQAAGLPDNSITAVLQTANGYLWIGTPHGLARFDGARFVTMRLPDRAGGASICVSTLCDDTSGRLWVGTQGDGLLFYADGVLSRFVDSGMALDATINSIAQDSSGVLWIGTPSGLYRLLGNKLSRLTSRNGLPNDFVSNVHVARSGVIWITTRGGICQFKGAKILPFPFQTDSPSRNPESLGVYEDRRGNLWAFGDTYLVNLTEGKHLNHFGQGDTLSSMRIWSLCEGRRGELWIGTSGKGLYCFAEEKFMPLSLLNGDLPSDVRALCEDREGNLWLGTYGGGLVRLQARNVRALNASIGLPNQPVLCLGFSPEGSSWVGLERGGLYTGTTEGFERVINGAAPCLQNLISSLCVAADSSLWVASPGNGLYCLARGRTVHYTTAQGLSDNCVLTLAADSQGAVWAGTASGDLHRFAAGRLTRYGAGSGLGNQAITALLPARKGGIWIGTEAGQIFRGESGVFHPRLEPGTLEGKTICALCEDASGRLWLGTSAGQLACLSEGRCQSWDINADSPVPHILGILGDEDGDLWYGTADALYRLSPLDISAALSGQAGLHSRLAYSAGSTPPQPLPYGWPRALKAPDGKLWFGMAGGVVALNVHAPQDNSARSPVLIEEVTVNGRPWLRPQTMPAAKTFAAANTFIHLPSDLQSLEFQFTAVNLSTPARIRFRYRLDGSDPNWVDSGADRIVHYGRLPFGQYTFRVQAAMDNNSWQENEATFAFVIPTPFWRTPWAMGLVGLAGVYGIGSTVRLVSNRRLRRRLASLAAQQAMERERVRIAQDMHDEIGSKLTKISFMSERAKGELQGQETVARKLDSIAHTSRDLLQSLDEIVWAVNPHNDTLQHLADYLGQYATEYLQNTAVECDLHIPNGLPHCPLSAEMRHNLFLAFEEALNNALKNGHASRIRIEMTLGTSRFEVAVLDNGCGFDQAEPSRPARAGETAAPKRTGNGLRNMRQRLSEAGGTCDITSQPGQGTCVRLSVPLGSAQSRNHHA